MFFTKWQFWLGLSISVVLLLVLVYQIDAGEIKKAFVDAGYTDNPAPYYTYLAPSIVLYFIAVFFRTVRWRYLLSPLREFPVARLYPVVAIGYMANNLLPLRLGELVRAYYLARQENITTSSALATIAVERIFDGITLLAFAALAAPWLLLLGEFDGATEISGTIAVLIIVLTVAAFLGFSVFFTLLASRPSFARAVEGWLVIVPAKLRPKAQDLFRTFVSGLAILSSPKKQMALFFLSLPVWLLEGGVYLLLAYSFNFDALFGSPWVLLLVVALLTATSNLATAVPSAIGGIGPFEVVAQKTLIALGVGAEPALAYSGFVHLVALWLPVNLVGLALLFRSNLSLKEIMSVGQAPGLEPAGGLSGGAPPSGSQ